MARRKRNLPQNKSSGIIKDDPLLLDEFSGQDLRTWQRNTELLRQYRIKQFYELESLRQLDRKELADALKCHEQVNLSINGWTRIVDHRYTLEPLSAKGSLQNGGRFNIGKDLEVSGMAPSPALYIAENFETAYAERFGSPMTDSILQPHELALRTSKSFTSVSLRGEITGLFDLRKQSQLKEFAKIIGRFKLTKDLRALARQLGMQGPLLVSNPRNLQKSLLGDWREMAAQYGLPANSQVFARFLQLAGFEGVLYPSTKGAGLCIALFLEQLDGSDSYIELADKAPAQVSITRLDSESAAKLF